MALLIPDSALSDPESTQGEARLLRKLKDNLDDSCIVWYQPKLPDSKRPDIIIYLPGVGLIIYEVKDWSLDNIISANADFWKIKKGDEMQNLTNPFKQSRNYFFKLKDKVCNEPSLQPDDPNFKGKIKIPIATAVAFPNINQSEYIKKEYDQVIECKYIIFKDEISAIGSKLVDKALTDKLKAHFDPWWSNDELDQDELNCLRAILYPEIISLQKTKGGESIQIILDNHQENVARKIGSGHNIVRGIAGSGKSLVLCAKIRMLLQEKPDWKILFICYNIALASQLRYYLKSFGNINDEFARRSQEEIDKRVEVVHFHGLCSRIFRETNTQYPELDKEQVMKTARFQNLKEHEKEAEFDEMNSILLGQTLQNVAMTKKLDLYNAIFVDESQDFHTSWLKSLLLLLDGKSNFLLLAEDPNQKIYPRKTTYKEAGIDVVGKKDYKLPFGYRSVREVVLTASRLVQTSDWDDFYRKFIEEEGEQDNDSIKTIKSGTFPEIIINSNYENLCDFIVDNIKGKLSEGYKYQDIGILYLTRTNKEGLNQEKKTLFDVLKPNINYVGGLQARLAMNGIPNFWLTKDRESKDYYDQFKETVTISTMFSAKGLEFEVVYIVGIELFPWIKLSPRENDSMLYVAMTRAKEKLYLLSTEKTDFVKRLEHIISELRSDSGIGIK